MPITCQGRALSFCPCLTLGLLQMKAEPSLSGMKEQELKKTVMPFAQMRMKETQQLGPEVTFLLSLDGDMNLLDFMQIGYSSPCLVGSHCCTIMIAHRISWNCSYYDNM